MIFWTDRYPRTVRPVRFFVRLSSALSTSLQTLKSRSSSRVENPGDLEEPLVRRLAGCVAENRRLLPLTRPVNRSDVHKLFGQIKLELHTQKVVSLPWHLIIIQSTWFRPIWNFSILLPWSDSLRGFYWTSFYWSFQWSSSPPVSIRAWASNFEKSI